MNNKETEADDSPVFRVKSGEWQRCDEGSLTHNELMVLDAYYEKKELRLQRDLNRVLIFPFDAYHPTRSIIKRILRSISARRSQIRCQLANCYSPINEFVDLWYDAPGGNMHCQHESKVKSTEIDIVEWPQ